MTKAKVIGRISRKQLRERTRRPERKLVSVGDALKKALCSAKK